MSSSVSSARPRARSAAGANPNRTAASASMPTVKRRTVRSGARLDSICAQAPSALVAKTAKNHASSPPTERATGFPSAIALTGRRAPRPAPASCELTLPGCVASHQQHHHVGQSDQQHQARPFPSTVATACRTARHSREPFWHRSGSRSAFFPLGTAHRGRCTPPSERPVATARAACAFVTPGFRRPISRRHHQVGSAMYVFPSCTGLPQALSSGRFCNGIQKSVDLPVSKPSNPWRRSQRS